MAKSRNVTHVSTQAPSTSPRRSRAPDPDVTGAKKRKQGNLPTNRNISESARTREPVPDRQP